MEKETKTAPVNVPETKEAYEAPVIETIEVRVEQGFQASLGDPRNPGDGGGGGDDGGQW